MIGEKYRFSVKSRQPDSEKRHKCLTLLIYGSSICVHPPNPLYTETG